MKTTKINAIVRTWQNIFVATMFSLAISFNMQAQETVIAVWDFANNSVAGEIHPDFASAANPDLSYLQGGGSGDNAFTNEDETGGDLDMSFTMSTTSANANGWSNFVLNNLHLGPSSATPTGGSGLVDNKVHFSVSFKEITIAQGSGDKVTFILKNSNGGNGAAGGTSEGAGTNQRITGLQIAENGSNNTTLKASTFIINGGNTNGTTKLAGHFGPTQGYTLTDLTIGVTVDYSVGSIRFWIDSPDTYASGDGSAWGFKMYNSDGWANTNGFPGLTATPAAGAGLADAVVQMMQFSPVLQDAGSKMVLDQVKISTGTYENTVEAGNTVSPSGVTAPWSDDFEDADASDWTLLQAADASQGWVLANGASSIVMYHADDNVATGVDNYLISPLLDCSGLTAPLLTFSETGSYQSYYTRHSVVYSTDYDGTNASTATWIDLYEGAAPTSMTEMVLDIPNTTTAIAFRYEGDFSDTWQIDDVSVADTPTEPLMSVEGSSDGASATFSFDIQNFTVGAAGDTGVDGHIHYSLNGGGTVMVYSSDDLTLSDLPNGNHTIVFSLVDNGHNPLDPPVTATVEFSTFDGTVACGETASICYDSDSSSDPVLWFSSTAAAGEVISVTFAGGTENGYDFVTVTNGAGTQIGDPLTGDLNGVTVTSDDGTVMVYINPDTSWSCVSGQSGFASLDATVSCEAAPLPMVTFTVNTANIEVGPNGIYLGGGVFGGANAVALSDDDADGTWEVTVEMEAGTTGNYAFFNSPDAGDAWGTKENLDGQECADPNAYNDRTLPQIDGDMTIQHCFGSCESDGTCPAPAPTYDVTFSVDMSNYVLGLGDGDVVYLNGNFAGWCGDCLPMSDDDGDGIWTITIPLEDGDYEYKFTVNGWNNQESWPGDDGVTSCDTNVEAGGFENRAFSVAGEDMTLATVYWNLCVGEVPGVFHTVTFEVNTSAIVGGVGPNGIYAGGGILGNAQGLQLTDEDGDGVYVGSIDLEEGTTGNYIFLNSPSDGGDWGAKENLEGQDCADPANYNDRILEPVTGDVTLLACFGFCSGNGTGECPSDIVTYNVTFSVNTANITVGENGMYAGGGVLGGANALALLDDDNDGVWEATIPMEEGTSGNYAYFNSPSSSDDWGTKENIEGQDCADPANYNDRILAPITEDTVLLACFGQCSGDGTGICPAGDPAMMLQGIMDFTITDPDADPDTEGNQTTYNVSGAQGKAIHLYVNEDIEDLSLYGLGVANNGGGTDGEEWVFPAGSALAGQHILVARSLEAMEDYLSASSIFDQVILAEGNSISQNGDDAIELYFLGGVIETFGDPNTDGSGQAWEYLDSWAYKVNGDWTYGGVNCSDPESGQSTTTSCESGCPYPFADCGPLYDLTAEGGWRYQYEVAGYRGVGPGDAMSAVWWNAGLYEDFNNATYPNASGVDNGLVDDIMFFYADGSFMYDTGEDGSIMGKKPEVDAAFDPTGENAYPADNEYNEYWNYPLDDFSDTYALGNDGTYDIIEFSTVGALGFYTSTGAQAYQILSSTANTIYVRNVGSEGNSWYSMLTTDAHNLSTSENEILDMMIYPNPVDGNYVTILSPVQGLKEIEVYSVTGRKVIDIAINGSTLDVSSLNTGFYLLKVTINGQNKVSKLVVK